MASDSKDAKAPISLPKGGGAIKGIGETFQPNLFSGTGNFSVPIFTSPGRNGFGPRLTLQYSTGNGNGPFGLGWQLSIPRITRKTEKGLPTYTDEDVFVMSGAEDLVPYLERISVTDGPDRWEPVLQKQDDFKIQLYRPRTEGQFARVEKWTKDGDVHWRAITRDNVTSVYGRTEAARLVDPQHHENVFEWLLEETFDARGNHIAYEYMHENPELTLPGIHEHNRSYTQAYIRRILYGNTPDNLNAELRAGPIRSTTDHTNPLQTRERHYVFEVLFDYGEFDDGDVSFPPGIPHEVPLNPEEMIPDNWPLRDDPFSSFRAGFEIRTLRRCRRVMMLHHFKEGEIDGAPLVKSTEFDYEINFDTQLSQLKSVTVLGYRQDPNNPEGYLERDMPPVTFDYSVFEPSKQRYQSVTANGGDLPPQGLNASEFTLMDVFGDGLPDILQTAIPGFHYWQNLGQGRVDRRRAQSGGQPTVSFAQGNVSFGDMAGDGLADLVVATPTISGFYESTPDGDWRAFKRFEVRPSFELDDPNTRLVDLTGDGLSDVLVTRDDHFLWFRCEGEAGYEVPRMVPRRHDLDAFPDVYFSDSAGRVRLADMAGDGLNDIVLVHDGRIDYWPNLGYGKFGRRITMANTPRIGFGFDPRRLFLADLDGTGCADLVYVESGQVHSGSISRAMPGAANRQSRAPPM
jgi:Salmonella virulence plasmid 65kDa B protein/FG-GAP-like repeat